MNFDKLFKFVLLLSWIVFNTQSADTLAQSQGSNTTLQVEAKNMVGTINRSQQAYHFERQEFSDSLSQLGISFPSLRKYNEPVIKPSKEITTVIVSAMENDLTSFSGAVSYNQGIYKQIICVTNAPSTTIAVPSVQGDNLICPPGTSEIR